MEPLQCLGRPLEAWNKFQQLSPTEQALVRELKAQQKLTFVEAMQLLGLLR